MVRSLVVNWLLTEKRYAQLKDLLETYGKDNSAAIKYVSLGLEVWNDSKMIQWIKEKKKIFI